MNTLIMEMQRNNVTPAQFLSAIRATLKKKGCEFDITLEDFKKQGHWSDGKMTKHDNGALEVCKDKPYDKHFYYKDDEHCYNMICEFQFDDEKIGYGYFYTAGYYAIKA